MQHSDGSHLYMKTFIIVKIFFDKSMNQIYALKGQNTFLFY